MKSVAVIGAGPAGLTTAYLLARKGVEVEVFEAGDAVGGMARTLPLWGQRVDLGPHRFFSSDPRVNALWLELVGRDYSMVKRLTRIYYQGRFFDYPLKPLNALQGLGPWEAAHCIASYANAQLQRNPSDTTFEDWVSNRFGKRLYSIFFKSYSEKLWGIPCDSLDKDFATQRIKKLSLFEAMKSALRANRGNTHKTLVDEFAYPHGGAGMVYERMYRRITEAGGRIHLNSPVLGVSVGASAGGRPALRWSAGGWHRFDHVVSTMPITTLVKLLGAPRDVAEHAGALRFRNTILVYLKVVGDSPFPDQWIYVHSPGLKTGRITNFRNWVPHILRGQPETILCLEFWADDDEPIWAAEEQRLIERATAEIAATGLVPVARVRDGRVVRVPKCYPVYAVGYRRHLDSLQGFLAEQRGLSVLGRYGAFKYNNQDHSILMGMLAAENIADGAQHDLWGVNADYEYQEASRITATGLQAAG